jgi:hypothetical protein
MHDEQRDACREGELHPQSVDDVLDEYPDRGDPPAGSVPARCHRCSARRLGRLGRGVRLAFYGERDPDERVSPAYLIWEQAQAELITGSAEPMAVEHRSLLADEALKWAAGSPYRINYVKLYEASFAHQWAGSGASPPRKMTDQLRTSSPTQDIRSSQNPDPTAGAMRVGLWVWSRHQARHSR